MNACVSEVDIDLVILEVSIASMKLKTVITDPEAFVCGVKFGHGTDAGHVWVVLIQHGGCLTNHQSGRKQTCCHVGQLELGILEAGQGLVELFADFDVLNGSLDRSLRGTQAARS